MKKLFVFCLAVALVAVACSKEQRVVNKLEGTWKGTSAKASILGIELDFPLGDFNVVYTFHPCKVKEGACDGTYTLETVTDNFSYTIGGKGTTIDWVDSSGTTQSLEILELDKETFKVKEDFGLDTTGSAEITITFTKQ